MILGRVCVRELEVIVTLWGVSGWILCRVWMHGDPMGSVCQWPLGSVELLASVQPFSSGFPHGKDSNALSQWRLCLFPVLVMGTEKLSHGNLHAELFPSFFPAPWRYVRPDPSWRWGAGSCQAEEFSHLSQGPQHPNCSPRRWEDCKLVVSDEEVGIRPIPTPH